MRISKEEQEAIKTVLDLGKKYGYGNLMHHLATAWRKQLMEKYDMKEELARRSSLIQGYPLKMQEDLIERGEWDETGERYKS